MGISGIYLQGTSTHLLGCRDREVLVYEPEWRTTMTPLRQRMIDDMRLAGFAERTRAKGQTVKLLLMVSQLDGEHVNIGVQLDRRLDIPAELPDDDFSAVFNLGRIWARLEKGDQV
jgi:hypothetical protein